MTEQAKQEWMLYDGDHCPACRKIGRPVDTTDGLSTRVAWNFAPCGHMIGGRQTMTTENVKGREEHETKLLMDVFPREVPVTEATSVLHSLLRQFAYSLSGDHVTLMLKDLGEPYLRIWGLKRGDGTTIKPFTIVLGAYNS